jgi:hypothetical protein
VRGLPGELAAVVCHPLIIRAGRTGHRRLELPVAAARVASDPGHDPPGSRGRRRRIARFAIAAAEQLSPAGGRSPTAVGTGLVASRLHLGGATDSSKGRTMTTTFETLASDLLIRPSGGVRMQLTQYGYPNDPYSDSETRKGHGAYHSLVRDQSLAMTDSGLRALGLSRSEVRSSHPWVDIKLRGGGTLERRIDDRAPESNMRADLYQPGGFDRRLPDFADVALRP